MHADARRAVFEEHAGEGELARHRVEPDADRVGQLGQEKGVGRLVVVVLALPCRVVVAHHGHHVVGLRKADEGHLVEAELGGQFGGTARAADDAHRGVGVGGGDGGAGQAHALVGLLADGVATVGPAAGRAYHEMRRVVGAASREGEHEILPAHQVVADAEQVVAELLGEHAGLHVRTADVHDADVALAEKDDRVHLAEKPLHGRAVAGKHDAVAVQMGKRQLGHRLQQGGVLRHKHPVCQKQRYESQPIPHRFTVLKGW